jgi:hypothetical protein
MAHAGSGALSTSASPIITYHCIMHTRLVVPLATMICICICTRAACNMPLLQALLNSAALWQRLPLAGGARPYPAGLLQVTTSMHHQHERQGQLLSNTKHSH